jgi:hypothetical protein
MSLSEGPRNAIIRAALPWLLCVVLSGSCPKATAQTVRVDATTDHFTNTFRPTEALGAAVDRIPLAATDKIFTEPVIKQILSAGWQTVTYRQNTELYVEAWHWNPKGKPLMYSVFDC